MSPKTKLWLGVLIAVICGLIATAFLLLIPYQYFHPLRFSISDIISSVYSVCLFSFGLSYGLRLIKRSKQERDANRKKEPSAEQLTFTTFINLAEYRRLTFLIIFKHPMLVYLAISGLAFVAESVLSGGENQFATWIGLFFLFLPISVLITISRAYSRTPALNEVFDCMVSIDGIDMKGASFNTYIRWTGVIKVRELSNWMLVYTSPQIAMILSKDKMDVAKFRRIVRTVPGLIQEMRQS